MDDYVQKHISTLVESDFPQYYREEGPVLVEFIKKYYEWMESANNELYHSRRLLEYGDIDDTVDDFLVYFKEKYLKGIQFTTETNTRQLIKHTLDLYRTKGTERSISLLFALVFGESVSVYYPGEDIFKLSDGKWVKPKYIEINPKEYNINLVGKQIKGVKSKATAYVERLIRRKIKTKYIEVLYISAINGNFTVGEKLTFDGAVLKNCPYMIGSTTSFDIIDGGTEFSIGDIVDIISPNGTQAKGRVANTKIVTGIVDFTLEHGGWGYTANAEVLVSEKVLTLSNTTVYGYEPANNDYPLHPFSQFDTITQPLANIQYAYANGAFSNNTTLRTYYSNGSVSGTGRIISTSTTNSTAGYLLVVPQSGNLESNVVIYSPGNAVTANVVASGYDNFTATANIIAWSSNVVITVSNTTENFVNGEIVVQRGLGNEIIATGTVNTYISSFGVEKVIVINSNGVFKSNSYISGLTSGANAYVKHFEVNIGVIDISNNEFVKISNNWVYTTSNTDATITKISTGTGATFGIANTLLNTEEVRICTDFCRDYVNVALNAASWGLNGNAAANMSCIIIDGIELVNATIGEISYIQSENPGSDYDTAPFVVIYEPTVASHWKLDWIINITNNQSTFIEGEIITQDTTEAQAIVKLGSNSTVLYCSRILFSNTFSNTNYIVGEVSGAIANVTGITVDVLSKQIGINSNVSTNVVSGNGVVSKLDVFDSGFGYLQDEIVFFTSDDGLRSGRVKVNLLHQGSSAGFYKNRGSFLSSDKYLHDGRYYQEYSYEVRSSIALNKYSRMLREIVHVAGTQFFGAYIKKSIANSQLSISNTTITVE